MIKINKIDVNNLIKKRIERFLKERQEVEIVDFYRLKDIKSTSKTLFILLHQTENKIILSFNTTLFNNQANRLEYSEYFIIDNIDLKLAKTLRKIGINNVQDIDSLKNLDINNVYAFLKSEYFKKRILEYKLEEQKKQLDSEYSKNYYIYSFKEYKTPILWSSKASFTYYILAIKPANFLLNELFYEGLKDLIKYCKDTYNNEDYISKINKCVNDYFDFLDNQIRCNDLFKDGEYLSNYYIENCIQCLLIIFNIDDPDSNCNCFGNFYKKFNDSIFIYSFQNKNIYKLLEEKLSLLTKTDVEIIINKFNNMNLLKTILLSEDPVSINKYDSIFTKIFLTSLLKDDYILNLSNVFYKYPDFLEFHNINNLLSNITVYTNKLISINSKRFEIVNLNHQIKKVYIYDKEFLKFQSINNILNLTNKIKLNYSLINKDINSTIIKKEDLI